MVALEGRNTMIQNAFVKSADGQYAIRVTGTANGDSPAALETVIPVVARVTSTFADGKQAAPTAGTAIATSANLAAGTWDVEVTTFIGGTTVANLEINNMNLKFGATQLSLLGNPVPGTAGATDMGKYKCRIDVPAPTPVSVTAVATATAGSIYFAHIVATRVN
jgi:hypothetical protein